MRHVQKKELVCITLGSDWQLLYNKCQQPVFSRSWASLHAEFLTQHKSKQGVLNLSNTFPSRNRGYYHLFSSNLTDVRMKFQFTRKFASLRMPSVKSFPLIRWRVWTASGFKVFQVKWKVHKNKSDWIIHFRILADKAMLPWRLANKKEFSSAVARKMIRPPTRFKAQSSWSKVSYFYLFPKFYLSWQKGRSWFG